MKSVCMPFRGHNTTHNPAFFLTRVRENNYGLICSVIARLWMRYLEIGMFIKRQGQDCHRHDNPRQDRLQRWH